MREIATAMKGKVRFVLRGYPAGTIAGGFNDLLGDPPVLDFRGPYAYPDDLSEMYGGIDFNWAFDESDPSRNSAWLGRRALENLENRSTGIAVRIMCGKGNVRKAENDLRSSGG